MCRKVTLVRVLSPTHYNQTALESLAGVKIADRAVSELVKAKHASPQSLDAARATSCAALLAVRSFELGVRRNMVLVDGECRDIHTARWYGEHPLPQPCGNRCPQCLANAGKSELVQHVLNDAEREALLRVLIKEAAQSPAAYGNSASHTLLHAHPSALSPLTRVLSLFPPPPCSNRL